MAVAVKIENVSKDFRVPAERFSSLKERLLHVGRVEHREFHALKDVSIDIEEGQTFALLGHNGSGKSTLLKCVAGILRPSQGRVLVRGRMAALLELGAGFHPDLTGRENIFMNATLLGVPKREVEKRFDDIVAFAELEEFIDNQVKHYSSGMYVRLGFAVAVNMDPDVLLVDEVLAVGDEAFQRKCLERVRLFQKEGRTIIVVTHSADMVRQICDRAAVLDHGDKVAEGPPGEAIRVYREYLAKRGVPVEADSEILNAGAAEVDRSHGQQQESKATKAIKIDKVLVSHPHSSERKYLEPGEGLNIDVSFTANKRMEDVVFGVAVHDADARLVWGWNTTHFGVELEPLEGSGQIKFDVENVPLLEGDYKVSVSVHNRDGGTVYDWHDQRYEFAVMNPTRTIGYAYAPATLILPNGQTARLVTGE